MRDEQEGGFHIFFTQPNCRWHWLAGRVHSTLFILINQFCVRTVETPCRHLCTVTHRQRAEECSLLLPKNESPKTGVVTHARSHSGTGSPPPEQHCRTSHIDMWSSRKQIVDPL